MAFAWRAMDAFYEEDERIVGHAADPYHRIDIRQASLRLTVRHEGRVIADSTRPLALYESGFAPRWYVPRADVDTSALTPAEDKTFCPYKGMCSYWDVSGLKGAVWGYESAWPEVGRISGMLSFEPGQLEVRLNGARLQPGAGAGRYRARRRPRPERRRDRPREDPVTAAGPGSGTVTTGLRDRTRPDSLLPVLVSVNVGLPENVPWQGKTVRTGAWKYPVDGPVMARRLNLDGDGQGDLAGHGGEQRAVLVYQLDSYRHWRQHFGRDDFTTACSERT